MVGQISEAAALAHKVEIATHIAEYNCDLRCLNEIVNSIEKINVLCNEPADDPASDIMHPANMAIRKLGRELEEYIVTYESITDKNKLYRAEYGRDYHED